MRAIAAWTSASETDLSGLFAAFACARTGLDISIPGALQRVAIELRESDLRRHHLALRARFCDRLSHRLAQVFINGSGRFPPFGNRPYNQRLASTNIARGKDTGDG